MTNRFNNRPYFTVTQLGLGLAFKLGVWHPDGNNHGNPFPNIITAELFPQVFRHNIVVGVTVDTPGQGCPKTHDMGAPLLGVNVVDVRKKSFVVAIEILKSHLHLNSIPFAKNKNRFAVNQGAVAVEILDKGFDPALEMKFIFGPGTFIMEQNFDLLVEKSQFPQAVLNGFVFKIGGFGEDIRIGEKGDPGAAEFGDPNDFHLVLLDPVTINLAMNLAFPFYLSHSPNA